MASVDIQPARPRFDWYQTQSTVCVDVMVKGARKEDVSVELTERSAIASIQLPGSAEYFLHLHLAHSINPAKSLFKVLSSKIELRLCKLDGLHWASLERRDTATPAQPQPKDVHQYPSSKHYTSQPDWDRLAADITKEEKEEKLEGDAALNNLFQQIYRDGSDDVRKAMNKSFVESGGTVLSTNWSEVGSSKVEKKPPEGMEWREYEK